jgi:hypothetical protein
MQEKESKTKTWIRTSEADMTQCVKSSDKVVAFQTVKTVDMFYNYNQNPQLPSIKGTLLQPKAF